MPKYFHPCKCLYVWFGQYWFIEKPTSESEQRKITHPLSILLLLLFAWLGFISAGNNSVSSISTISTSPDWISAAPSHDIIIGIQSPPPEQFSGVCKNVTWREKEGEEEEKKDVKSSYFRVSWFNFFGIPKPKRIEKQQKKVHACWFIKFSICKFVVCWSPSENKTCGNVA